MPLNGNGKKIVIGSGISGGVILLSVLGVMGKGIIENERLRVVEAKEIRREIATGDDCVRKELKEEIKEWRTEQTQYNTAQMSKMSDIAVSIGRLEEKIDK